MVKRKSDDKRESHAQLLKDSAISTRRQKRSKSSIVDDANGLDEDEFSRLYLNEEPLNQSDSETAGTDISLHYAKHLNTQDLDACFDLVETTSRDDYEASSWGWHPKRKKREMRETEMRYLLLTVGDASSPERAFEGFLSFMLTHDSTPSVPVLYVYEIHLTKDARGRGFGHRLMSSAEDIAQRVGVDKVMLTCFLSNTHAHNFYKRLGYATDECSPGDRKTRNKVVKTDYVIMSKDLRRREHQSMTANGKSTEDTAALQVIPDEEHMDDADAAEANNKATSLDECETALRAWVCEHRAMEVLNEGLAAADLARRELCANNTDAASRHREDLAEHQTFLQNRYEAARDLSEILREQMYHLKSHISDVNRLAEIMENAIRDRGIPQPTELPVGDTDDFDMEKATEQVYAAFYTLMRKAEEIDNRLDNVADREEEASLLEYDLNQREEELDGWEDDIQEREKALAAREERLIRSKSRLVRRRQRVDEFVELVASSEGEEIRALPWRQESPSRDKVGTWLWDHSTPEQEDLLALTIDDDPPRDSSTTS